MNSLSFGKSTVKIAAAVVVLVSGTTEEKTAMAQRGSDLPKSLLDRLSGVRKWGCKGWGFQRQRHDEEQKLKTITKGLPKARISTKISVSRIFFEPDLMLWVPGPKTNPKSRSTPKI